jgi:hypothetical protein
MTLVFVVAFVLMVASERSRFLPGNAAPSG